MSGNLYYSGLKEYYIKNSASAAGLKGSDAEYKHTVLEDKVLYSSDITDYKLASEKLNETLVKEQNENIVNFIQYNMPYKSRLEDSNVSQISGQSISPQSIVNNGQTLVKNYGFFSRLKNCGYISGGKCGYIAAGILMAYRQNTFGEAYMPASYLNYSSSVRIKMQVTPNNNGPKVVVSANANRIYYTLRNASGTIVSQSYVDANYNAWDFAQWNNLAAGQYRFQVQAPGGNVETITFTKGNVSVRTNINVLPDPIGPQVAISTNANKIYYTLRNSSNGIVSQSHIDTNYNSWDFSCWTGLAAGQYRFQVQAPGGNVETITFTVNNPSLSTSLATTLYNVGVEKGEGSQINSKILVDVVNNYLSKYGYSKVNYYENRFPFATTSNVASNIDLDRPVIMFGNIFENSFDERENIMHAVVAYGYKYDGIYNFIAHFGWDNATEVYFSGLLIGMYTCWR